MNDRTSEFGEINTKYGNEDRQLRGGRHGIGNLAQDSGDEQRGRGCFQGEEESGDPKVGAKPPVNEAKPTL